MFELKKGMKVKNKFGNIHIFLELINGEYWFENRTCNLEDEINWEETAKLNGIDLEKQKYIESLIEIGYSEERIKNKVNEVFGEELGRKENKVKIRPNLLPITELKDVWNKEYNPKYDKDKLDWTLLPITEVEEIVKVLNYGVNKYGKANAWQGVENAEQRYLSATYRHLVEYTKGNKIDNESGLSHLSHLATNIIFLMWFERSYK